jgi:hypothetical protein
MKKTLLLVLMGWLFCMMNDTIQGQQLAFPGAEGYGKYTTGGRGGRVIEVTNLSDKNKYGATVAGSLRAALATSGTDPITIVFKVSGIIKLADVIKCSRPNITLAGQTAPGDGICISQEKIQLSGNNVIIRYLRFRVGDVLQVSEPCLDIENCSNIIVDHCSLSWAVEENMDNYDTRFTTVQWCVLSEALYNSYNSKGARSYAAQWGGQYASYHHNLLASCYHRSPRINGCQSNDTVSLVDFRNNVIFNWSGNSSGIYGGEYEQLYPDSITNVKLGAGSFNNFVNNYYKPGPASQSAPYLAVPSYVRSGDTAVGYGKWYFNGNYLYGSDSVTEDNWKGVSADKVGSISNIKVDNEFTVSSITTQTAAEAYALVLDSAGAIRPKRDAVDTRVIGVVTGDSVAVGGATLGTSTGIIDSQTDVGGWPTYRTPETDLIPADTDSDGMPDKWETANGLDPTDSTDRNIVGTDGYTNLEHYLNSDISYISPDSTYTDTTKTSTISKSQTINFSVYPNPSSDRVYFQTGSQISKIELYDLVGKLVFVKEGNESSIAINSFATGFYTLKVTFTTGQSVVRKISKL